LNSQSVIKQTKLTDIDV